MYLTKISDYQWEEIDPSKPATITLNKIYKALLINNNNISQEDWLGAINHHCWIIYIGNIAIKSARKHFKAYNKPRRRIKKQKTIVGMKNLAIGPKFDRTGLELPRW